MLLVVTATNEVVGAGALLSFPRATLNSNFLKYYVMIRKDVMAITLSDSPIFAGGLSWTKRELLLSLF